MQKRSLGPISKYSGAGNSFAIIDARPSAGWKQKELELGLSRKEIAVKACDATLGLGADGFLFIEEGSSEVDFVWDFYNLDGSPAEMCGNAARCAAAFCADHNLLEGRERVSFKTGAGIVSVNLKADKIFEVQMPPAEILNMSLEINTITAGPQKFIFINTGVPHSVQKIQSQNELRVLKSMAKEVRAHDALAPHGTNVTFFSETGINKISACTFERGVEDFTLACGTGAVAAALAYQLSKPTAQLIEVNMPGGQLFVSLVQDLRRPILIGEAQYLGDFNLNL